jgi:hypothetical protein
MLVANDVALDGFPAYNHEPYYADYTRTDLPVREGGRDDTSAGRQRRPGDALARAR